MSPKCPFSSALPTYLCPYFTLIIASLKQNSIHSQHSSHSSETTSAIIDPSTSFKTMAELGHIDVHVPHPSHSSLLIMTGISTVAIKYARIKVFPQQRFFQLYDQMSMTHKSSFHRYKSPRQINHQYLHRLHIIREQHHHIGLSLAPLH